MKDQKWEVGCRYIVEIGYQYYGEVRCEEVAPSGKMVNLHPQGWVRVNHFPIVEKLPTVAIGAGSMG
jgi:hypothetical protein